MWNMPLMMRIHLHPFFGLTQYLHKSNNPYNIQLLTGGSLPV